MSMRRKFQYVRRNALQHQTKMQATHCRCLHDIPRDERSQAWCPAVAEASFPLPKSLWERSTKKRESTHRFSTASRMMKFLVQASYNITGQTNGANIWITSDQSIFRTMPLQNNWNVTPSCVIFGVIRNKLEKGPMKSGPSYHQTTRAIVSMNKEAGQTQ